MNKYFKNDEEKNEFKFYYPDIYAEMMIYACGDDIHAKAR